MPRQHEFQIIVRHPEHGPTLEELHSDLADWFSKVLITKEFVKPKVEKSDTETHSA